MRTLLIFFLLQSVCPANFVFAQNATTELLSKVQKHYEKYTSFSATFKQELFNPEAALKEERVGEFIFARPLRVFWKTTQPAEEYVVVSDSVIWNYVPQDNAAYKYPISMLDDFVIFIHILTGRANVVDNFIISKVETRASSKTFFMQPKEENPNVTSIELTVSSVNFEIESIKTSDFYNNTNTVTITSMKKNIPVESSIFSFIPAAGVSIIDNTYDVIDGGQE
ncbi:MAG: LolA family protein [Desulfovibrionaceae bacterium]